MPKESIGAKMAALRYQKMSAEERTEAARHAAESRWSRLTPAERSVIARKAAETRRRNRAAKPKKKPAR